MRFGLLRDAIAAAGEATIALICAPISPRPHSPGASLAGESKETLSTALRNRRNFRPPPSICCAKRRRAPPSALRARRRRTSRG